MDPLKWFRRKPKAPPPAIQFHIPVSELPPKVQERIAAGAKCTMRQYPAERLGRHKFRSHCIVFLDGNPVASTDITWKDTDVWPDDSTTTK